MRISLWTIAILLTIRLLTMAASAPPTRALAADSPPSTSQNLLPIPRSVVYTGSRFPLSPNLTIDTTARGDSDPRVRVGVQRMVNAIEQKIGKKVTKHKHPVTPEIAIICDASGAGIKSVGDDESYTINVHGFNAVIEGRTALGVLHGMQTFQQLIQHGDHGFFVPCVHIEDSPRFQWRGLLIDCSRHFISADTIKRNLDLMERCKLNVFHWHLSDDQGFRVESKVFPRLQEYGSDGKYYTQDQIKDIIAYARDRGIRVVPEFDMPGHSTSWFVGYPELASAPGPYVIQTQWGVFDPAMNPTRESTYTFLDKFIGEMAGLFPDQYFHIGGDEVNGKQWDANPAIQKFMHDHKMTSNTDLQAYFNGRIHEILVKYHKTMIGWDEVLNPTIPKDIVVQSWRGQKSLADAAQLGHDTILSSGYYLDSLQPSSTYYANDPLGGDAAALTSDVSSKVIGGEICMWGEHISNASVTDRIWPRAAAIAERLWSPASVKDTDSLRQRLATFDQRVKTSEMAFQGKPTIIPGVIQAADYDEGGEGIGYHDTADYNAGAEYRPHDYVGIEDCRDDDGGHNISNAAPGEWLKYTIDVKRTARYRVQIRAASREHRTKLHFEDVYGNRLGDDIEIHDTHGWQKWNTVEGSVLLSAGRQTIKLVEDTGNYNVHTFTFSPAN